MNLAQLTITDMTQGFFRWRLWMNMAKLEVLQKYRGSVLGPFWNTLSYLILIIAMGLIFTKLWGAEKGFYMPYLASGMLSWFFLTDLIVSGSAVFLANGGVIKQSALPYSVFALNAVTNRLILFCHHSIAFVFIAIYFQVSVNANTLLLIPGLALFLINGMCVGMALGAITCRYRDIQPLLQNILQVSFFVTPVFWSPERLGPGRSYLVDANPLFHFLSIIREPMMGIAPASLSWWVTCSITVIVFIVTLFLFGRCRKRITYWL